MGLGVTQNKGISVTHCNSLTVSLGVTLSKSINVTQCQALTTSLRVTLGAVLDSALYSRKLRPLSIDSVS